jgi:hypothetical protein
MPREYQGPYDDAALLVEQNLDYINDNDASILVEDINHIDATVIYLRALIEKTGEIVALPPLLNGDAAAEDGGDSVDAISERTKAYKARMGRHAAKLLTVARLKRDLIVGYKDAVGTLYADFDGQLAQAQVHIDAINSILTLIELSGKVAPDPDVVEINKVKKGAELAVIQLKIRRASELAQDSLVKFKAIKERFETAEVILSGAALTRVNDRANVLFNQIKTDIALANRDIDAAKNALNGSALEAGDVARVNKLNRQLNEANAYNSAIIKRLAKKGNTFMAINDALDKFFNVELLKASTDAAKNPATANLPAAKPDPLTIAAAVALPVYYQKVQLEPGDVIRSTATFGIGAAAKTGILIQNDEGEVVNITPPGTVLDRKSQAIMALKQANMLMARYDPSAGDVIIKGAQSSQAMCVYAALLYLQRENASLKDMKIKSLIPRCELVGKFYKSEKDTKNDFIHDYFEQYLMDPDSVAESMYKKSVKDAANEAGLFVTNKLAREYAHKEQLAALKNTHKDDTLSFLAGKKRADEEVFDIEGDQRDSSGIRTRP